MDFELSNSPCKVTITISAKWNWWSVIGAPLIFGFVWRYQTMHGGGNFPPLFLALCIGSLVLQLLWTLGGREILCFGDEEVTAKKQILFFSRSHHFPMNQISEPFFVPAVDGGEHTTPSGIGFDFLGKHYRFQDHLEETDVLQIVSMVRGAYPHIAAAWDKPEARFATDGIITLGLSRS